MSEVCNGKAEGAHIHTSIEHSPDKPEYFDRDGHVRENTVPDGARRDIGP